MFVRARAVPLAVAMCAVLPGTASIDTRPAPYAALDARTHAGRVLRAAAQTAAPPARHVDHTQLLDDVATLAAPGFEGRATGTPGGERARDWIAGRFAAAGLTPGGVRGYAQPFTITTRNVRAILPGGRPFRTAVAAGNVVGRVAGSNPRAGTIVVTAHFDHLGIRNGAVYPGADDNASGVAALLAAARHFVAHRPRHPMVFAALDGEEMGFRGARTLVASNLLPRGGIVLNVNLDMVSRNDRNEIYAAGTYHTPRLRPIIEDVQQRTAVVIRFGHDRPPEAGGGLEDWTRSSDHAVFHEAGVPFVYFGVEDHPDYHRPTDTADRIDPRFFGDVADMIVEALRTFDARLD